jgi:hypothetical protein
LEAEMARRRSFKPKAPPKRKRVSYELIDPKTDQGKSMHAMLNRLVEVHHSELTNARIALAWNRSWKPDADGHSKIGQCKKASDLDRELAPYDFVIMLRADFWHSSEVTDDQRRALLDHELCHATVKEGKDGEPARDERDRVIYRMRKHDVEEFSQIVERHGLYKRDLESFAAALRRSKQGSLPLAVGETEKPSRPPSKDEAAAALSQVGSRSLAEEFLDSEKLQQLEEHEVRRRYRDFCSDKGVRTNEKREELWEEVQRLRKASSEKADAQPLPSEPHAYEGNGKLCRRCGSDRQDPVHAAAPPAGKADTAQGQAPRA